LNLKLKNLNSNSKSKCFRKLAPKRAMALQFNFLTTSLKKWHLILPDVLTWHSCKKPNPFIYNIKKDWQMPIWRFSLF